MHFLVTGGCGFIGTHLCNYLTEQNHQVTVLDNLSTGKANNLHPKVELIVGDIRNHDLLQKCIKNKDGCFHLAAISSVKTVMSDWLNAHQTNTQGTLSVFQAAGSSNPPTPVVYASSAAIYGHNQTPPFMEDSQPMPISIYGTDKLTNEGHAKALWLSHCVPSTGLRFFNVYGTGQNPNSSYSGVITNFINALIMNHPLKIYGDGSQTRDFIHVSDVTKHLYQAMLYTRQGSEIYNVCTGISTSIQQLAEKLTHIAQAPINIEYCPNMPGDIFSSLGNPDKAIDKLRYSSKVSLLDGLKATWEGVKNDK